MIRMNDIYFKVDSKIVKDGYNTVDIPQKLNLVDQGLKEYALDKIREISPAKSIKENNKDDVTINDLVAILGELIPKEEHFETLRHFTHYVLKIAGDIQGFEIIWSSNETSILGEPRAIINENGKWEELNSHQEENLVHTFNFAYDILQNQILKNKMPQIH